MPTYRLKCRQCDYDTTKTLESERFEKLMERREGIGCPKCGTMRMDWMKSGQRVRDATFKGWGWHDGLNMMFLGPRHYREYLRENGLHEAGNMAAPQYKRPVEKEFLSDEAIRKVANIMGGLDDGSARLLKDPYVPKESPEIAE